MKPVLLVCLLSMLAHDAGAHRLDEYLQATRIAIATNGIELSIDLTPGAAVADQLLSTIDNNQDGQISKEEQASYSKRFLKDVQLRLDQADLALSLVDTSFPKPFEIKSGVGVICIKATAPSGQLKEGKHTVSITNTHLPAMSAYLVNALKPKNSTVRIIKQSRDELQKNYCLEFEFIASPSNDGSRQ